MSRRPDYIPRNMTAFFAFIQNLNSTVTANAGTWNLPANAVTDLQNAIMAFGPVFETVSNNRTRTREQMAAYQTERRALETQLRTFVQSYLVNNAGIPVSARIGMGLNVRGFYPRQRKTNITVAPIIALSALGGGKVRLRFKRPDGTGRPSLIADCTGIAYYFRFQPLGTAPVPVPPPPMPTDDQAGPRDQVSRQGTVAGLPTYRGYELEVVTRASIERQVPIDRIGSVMHVFAQYVNSSDPSKNGPYSMVSTVIVG